VRAARASLATLGTVAASRLRPWARYARLVEPECARPPTPCCQPSGFGRRAGRI